jgi:hypothetical protein
MDIGVNKNLHFGSETCADPKELRLSMQINSVN